MLVVGDREAAEGTVAVRSRVGRRSRARSALDEFIAAARDEIGERSAAGAAEGAA